MPFALAMALDAAWSILKRQRPRQQHAVPANPFDTKLNRIRELRAMLAQKPVGGRNNAFAALKRKKMAEELRQLQAEDEPKQEPRTNVDPRFQQSVANILGIGDNDEEYE